MPVKAGDCVTFDVLRWDEGWDFDCPVVVLRPIVRFSPNGEHAEEMVESCLEDASIDGELRSHEHDDIIDRQYPIGQLKRRWREAWTGKKEFPVKQYTAHRIVARFVHDDEDDCLVGEIVSHQVNGADA